MNGISFAHPWVLGFIALVPVLFAVWVWGVRRAERRVRAISRTQGTPPPYLAAVLLSLAACTAIAAAAQPRWGTRIAQAPRTGSDVVVVLDISRSMNVRDVEPDRLTASKRAIGGLANRLAGDRLGLVVFAGSARVRFPLTTDTAAAMKVVESLEAGAVFVRGGTEAALGLEEAVALLSDDESAGRIILLLTDGEDLGGDPAGAALAVAESGATLLIAGVGTTTGGPIPVQDLRTGETANLTDGDGNEIISALNENFLRAMAAAAGGQYIGSDLSVVAGVVEGRMRTLERVRLDEQSTILPVERHHLFSLGALALLVLAAFAERIARVGWRRGALVALSALALGGCASDVYETNEAGRTALAEGDANAAIEHFLDVQVERPSDPEVAINLAAAYHAAGRYDEAIFSARRALESNNPEIRARAFASIGHHQFASNRLLDALAAFRSALLEKPDDEDSRHNYEVVLRLLFPPETATPEPSATPEPGESPGAGEGTPGQGEGTPTPGDGPGEGTPSPGDPSGTPGSDEPRTMEDFERRLREIDAEVQRLIEEAGEAPTAAEALEILELLNERSRIAALRDALDGGVDPDDR